jgi:mycothione reductase
MPAKTHFDLVIVGSGSGNSVPTPELAELDTAIVESGTFGGTCLNVGCIPTKMYVHAAEVGETIRDAARFGIDATVDKVRWPDIRDRIFGRIDAIAAGGQEYRAHGPHTTLFESRARFVGDRALRLSDGTTITGDRIVLAAGSRATVPEVVTESGVPFHTSDTVMRIDALPARLTIVGGGYIGAEFAHVFSALGSEVTVLCRYDQLVRDLDVDLRTAFTRAALRQWDVRLGTTLAAAQTTDAGLLLTASDGSRIDSDLLLVATGRVSNGDQLDADLGGVALHPDGRIVVDEYLRTTADGVWALGDVSSAYQLKHVANHEARIVAHNLANPEDLRPVDHRFVPAAVFSNPQLATVGHTEDELTAAGTAHVTYVQQLASTAYGWALEDTTSFCKVIADPESGLLLGAHVLGPNASTVIQPLIQAMSYGQSVRCLARGQYWIHPAQSELVENALIGVEQLCRAEPGSARIP